MTAVTAAPVGSRGASPASRGLRYAAGLDGLRAIAVTAVLLFHAGVPWMPGGFLGVDVFFVLSGFLITSLLLAELRATGRLRFGQFYLRRARRLLPALFVLLVGTVVLALLFAPDAAGTLGPDALAALGYVSNWWFILHGLSYFEAIGRPPLLQHLWTLAIEEQFYLVWPAVTLVVYRWGRGRGVRRVGQVALIGALASTLLMAVMSIVSGAPAAGDVSRFYFGTDTHSMGLLLGAAFATVWRMDALPTRVSLAARAVLPAAGLAGLAGIGCFLLWVGPDTTWLYRGGFLLLSALTVLVIGAAVHPAVPFGAALGWGPLRYVGTRSYGLYLYHWPIFMLLRPGIDVPWSASTTFVVRFAATLAVAELSYRFVEMPVRRGAPLRAWRAYRGRAPQRAWLALWAGVLASALVAGSLGTALARTPSLQELDGLSGPTAIGDGNLSQEPPPTPVAPRPAPSRPGNSPTPRPSPVTPPVNTAVDFPPGTGVDLTTGPITAVGDSVLLGAHVAVQRVLPHVLIDAAVNRQSYTVLDRIRARLAAGRLAPVVVIHIGTNGPAVLSDLDSLLRLLSTRTRVVLVNMHAPESWNDSTNRVLARAASQFRNVVLADWAAASAGHREYFVADDTHLTHSGGRAYAAVIAEALGGCRDPVCPR